MRVELWELGHGELAICTDTSIATTTGPDEEAARERGETPSTDYEVAATFGSLPPHVSMTSEIADTRIY
jgi:hypothetical protein